MSSTANSTTKLLASENEKEVSPSIQTHTTKQSTWWLLAPLQHEVLVTRRLLSSNAIGFLFIFVGGMLSRAISAPLSFPETILALFKSLALCLLCSYVFDICNQTTSPEEDYMNKPDRPIPSGLITVEQGKTRWLLAWTLGPAAMYVLYGRWAMIHLLHWEVLITVCYVWPRWFSWFMRNYFASFSYCILGRLLNQVLAQGIPAWQISFLIDFTIFVWFMGTIHIQEFHDLEGDRKSDRVTLPMLLSPRGLVVLRYGTSLFTLLFGLGLAFAGYQKIGQDIITPVMCGLQLVASSVLAYRIVASTSAQYDGTTYHVYYYMPILTILLSLVLVTV